MKLSLNIHGQNIPDKPRLYAFLEKINPAWVLVMDELNVAREIKQLLPNCHIIFRAWPDDNLVKTYTPEAWVRHINARIGDVDVWTYAGNEQGFSDEVLNWNCSVIQHAQPFGLKVVVGNWSAGTPEPHDWERTAGRNLLELADLHRKTVALGLHEYACGVITSGILNPPQVHPVLWPRSISHLNMYHCGRYQNLLRACQKMNINPPRLVVTEFGFDDMPDIASWRDTLVKTPPFENIRGWKSLINQWQQWGHWHTPQIALFEQYQYANDVYYSNSAIEGVLIYSWGASSDQWKQFDVSEALEFQSLMSEVVTPKPTVPKPGRYIIESTTQGMNVRKDAGEDQPKQITLQQNQRLIVLPDQVRTVGDYEWFHVKGFVIQVVDNSTMNTNIVNFDGWSAATHATKLKPDVEPLPCPEPPPSPTLTLDEQDIVTSLTALLDKFKVLETLRADDWPDFQRYARAMQNIVLSRPVVRSQNAQT